MPRRRCELELEQDAEEAVEDTASDAVYADESENQARTIRVITTW